MTVTFGFYNSVSGDRIYDANQLGSIFDGAINDGIFKYYEDAFEVVTAMGLAVSVSSGRAWFNHTWTLNDAPLTVVLDGADPTLPRIDTIVIEVNRDVSSRTNSIKVITGTPAASPVPPTLTNSGTLHQYPLADIYVGAAVISILSGNITNRIGVDTPYATGIVETDLQTRMDVIEDRSFTFKNLANDGGMQIAQAGKSTSGVISSTGYVPSVDMIAFLLSGLGTWTVSQDLTGIFGKRGLKSSFKIQCTTAQVSPGASARLTPVMARIEGRRLQVLKKGYSEAEKMTLSFAVQSSKAGTFIVEIHDEDNSRHICKAFSITAGENKEFVWTIPGDITGGFLDNDFNRSLSINLWLGAGSNYTSGTLQTSWASRTLANVCPGVSNWADNTANLFFFSQVQLVVGDRATSFEVVPFDIELARVRRYYQKTFDYDTAPATAIGVHNGATQFHSNKAGAVLITSPAIPFINSWMRTIPTMTFYNPISANNQIRDRNAPGDTTATDVDTIGERAFTVKCTGNAATAVGNVLSVHWTADARL